MGKIGRSGETKGGQKAKKGTNREAKKAKVKAEREGQMERLRKVREEGTKDERQKGWNERSKERATRAEGF